MARTSSRLSTFLFHSHLILFTISLCFPCIRQSGRFFMVPGHTFFSRNVLISSLCSSCLRRRPRPLPRSAAASTRRDLRPTKPQQPAATVPGPMKRTKAGRAAMTHPTTTAGSHRRLSTNDATWLHAPLAHRRPLKRSWGMPRMSAPCQTTALAKITAIR